MSRIQIITVSNSITALALKFDEVKLYYTDSKEVYKGIIEQSPILSFDPNEITLGDTTSKRKLPFWNRFKKLVGYSPKAQEIELNRTKGEALAKLLGLAIPKTYVVNSVKEAINILKKEKDLYCVKFDDNLFGDSTFIPEKSNEEAIAFLESLEIKRNVKIDLQKVIKGYEVSTEAWFNSEGEVVNLNHTFERKPLLNGDIGPFIGCAFSIVWNVPESEWKTDLIGKYLLKPKMKEIVTQILKYVGPIDVNCIVDSKTNQPYFLEWTPRFGYSAIYAWWELLLEDNPFEKLFNNDGIIQVREDTVAYAYRVWLPPYPAYCPDENFDKKYYREVLHGKIIASEKFIKHPNIRWFDVYIEDGFIKCVGEDGVIAEVVSLDEPYPFGRIKKIMLCKPCARTDIPAFLPDFYRVYLNYPSEI